MLWSRFLCLCGLLIVLANASAQMPDAASSPPTPNQGAAEAPHSPAWLDSAVIYEIFPRSFSPKGDLNGITAKLDDLERLGVNVLWLMPLHPVGQVRKQGSSGSPYAVRDYYAIDPSYGTKQDLHRLIGDAHRRKMKVIIDIVANHTSFDSVMLAHPAFYKHDTKGNLVSPYDWTDVAALNYANPELRQYMTDMLVYWIRDFNLDGFRCDAAGEVPTDFWENARRVLNQIHPGVLMLAEASKPELLRNAFDLDYSWPLMAALNDVFEHGAAASAIPATFLKEQRDFPGDARHMRMFDDHDEQRALARYGIEGSLAAAALIFTVDGVPMIYNGMEISDPTESGAPALFGDLKIWWQAGQMRPQFPEFYRFMIPFREQEAALLHGKLLWLHNSDEARVVSYVRRTQDEEFLIAINVSAMPFRGTVEAQSADWQEVHVPVPQGHRYPVQAEANEVALPAVSLNAYQFRFFRRSLHAGAAIVSEQRPGSSSLAGGEAKVLPPAYERDTDANPPATRTSTLP